MIGGACALLLITAIFPRTGNPIGEFLFGKSASGAHLPVELFGVVWWMLGAWLVKSLLDLVLRRTIFPNDDEPHARHLFADLASALIYVLAFVGMVDTVFKQPISALLATSGVLAIVLGLALQNTLGDVFAGLAINIERPFAAGDWITIADLFTGQVIQVNWRATRVRNWAHDMVTISNSVAAKSMVTNHSRPIGPHRCVIQIKVDLAIPPSQVIEALTTAASGSPDIAQGTLPHAYACEFGDGVMLYELAFAIDNFAHTHAIRSHMLLRMADALREKAIPVGSPAMNVHILSDSPAANAQTTRTTNIN